ncbi:MAG: hypothetical protein RIC18_01520 [Hoeflea sp.]|uniref:hypothetical protein n=1 Tax=Hoeflea sp. TaxID=1940281 RepID=UPI0032EE7194
MLNKSAADILAHARNVHSQEGEDGIIEHLLSLLPARDNWCVEFGAWDGVYLSNTYHLIESNGYHAVLIEGSSERYAVLRKNMEKYKTVECMNRFVGFGADDGLDALLAQTGCPRDFDFLSVDIDGNDYHTIKAMTDYRPKLICVEFNPTIPSIVSYVQPADPDVSHGNSLRALYELGLEKGYKLACANRLNAFLVRADLWEGDSPARAEDLTDFRSEEPPMSIIFSTYDGTVMLTESHDMLWHDEKLTAADIQMLPAFIRRYPGDYNWLQWKIFKWRRRLRRLLGKRA